MSLELTSHPVAGYDGPRGPLFLLLGSAEVTSDDGWSMTVGATPNGTPVVYVSNQRASASPREQSHLDSVARLRYTFRHSEEELSDMASQDLPPYGNTNAEHHAWEQARAARDEGKTIERLIQELKDEQDAEGWAELDAAVAHPGGAL